MVIDGWSRTDMLVGYTRARTTAYREVTVTRPRVARES